MTLPQITLPKVELPFDIAVLLHPPVMHFMIAVPVIILILELINLILKKKAIGGISFFFVFLTVFLAAATYLTALVDGKEAYATLSEAGKIALSEYQLLWTYLLLGSAVLFFFKLVSVITKNGFMKFLYMLVLLIFVSGIIKQGLYEEELVYKYGMNVVKANTVDNQLLDLKEEIEALKAEVLKNESLTNPLAKEIVNAPERVTEDVKAVPTTPTEEVKQEIQSLDTLRNDVKEVLEMPKFKEMPKNLPEAQIATH